MSVYGRILLAGLGSALLLLGAFAFQYIGELVPCPLCIWQRWPHAVAVVVAIGATTLLWRLRRFLSVLGAVAMAVGAGLGVYHTGIEQGWWKGPSSCTGAAPGDLTTDELFDKIMDAPLILCDQIVWDMFGITMAGWNALISAGLTMLWIFAAYPKTPTRHIAPT